MTDDDTAPTDYAVAVLHAKVERFCVTAPSSEQASERATERCNAPIEDIAATAVVGRLDDGHATMTDTIHNPDEASDGVGRCDICNNILDPERDEVAVDDFGVPDELREEYGQTDQDAADAIANALSTGDVGEEDRLLAHTIRQTHGYRAHGDCLAKTTIDQLETG